VTATTARTATTGSAPPVPPPAALQLPADLEAGLRRLKLARIRALAPELLATAKIQRWTPEEVLRTLIEAEITARDASNAANRLKAAGFPVTKTLDSFDIAVSSIPATTFAYLTSLEWIPAQANLALIGPAVIRQDAHPDRPRRRSRRRRAQGPLPDRRRPGRDPLPGPGRQHRRTHHRHPAAKRLIDLG
jgi:IstB-like ATP binding protein